GGGIYLSFGVTIDGDDIEFTPGTLTMTRSTVSGNTVSGIFGLGLGGGIFVADLDAPATATGTTATITNSTISGNTASGLASSGGGLGGGAGAYRASVTFINSTVNRNSAD